jgi:MoaA/NifB/PqqE/SkfB family radical SAM enzyme
MAMRRSLPTLAANLVLRRPTTNVFFVTNRCNLDCAMCFYTARERREELSIEEIRALARSMPPQWYLMLTGGEPFIRPDLADIAAAFYDNGATNLHIATNATLFDRTIAGIDEIAGHACDARVIVVVSIDGPRAVHDRMRARAGSFDRTVRTTREIIALKRRHSNLAVLANYTFTAYNQHCWRETIDYLKDALGVDAVNVGLVRGQTKERETRDCDLQLYRAAHRYLALRQNRREYFPPLTARAAEWKQRHQVDLIHRIASGDDPHGYSCLAGRVFGVITETGDVYPCEMLARRFGNLRDVAMDYMRLWRSDAAETARAEIDTRACLCTYECAMGATLAARPGIAVRALAATVHRGA